MASPSSVTSSAPAMMGITPPARPLSAGAVVKKVQLRCGKPRPRTKARIRIRIAVAPAIIVHSTARARAWARRGVFWAALGALMIDDLLDPAAHRRGHAPGR